MDELVAAFEKLSLHEPSPPVVAIAFYIRENHVLEVAMSCSSWDLRYPLVFHVFSRIVNKNLGFQFWNIVQDQMVDLIAMSGAKMIFTYGTEELAILQKVIAGNCRSVSCNLYDIKRMGFREDGFCGFLLSTRVTRMLIWLRREVLEKTRSAPTK